MKLQIFNQIGFLPAIKEFFKELQVPINYVADEPTTAKEILKENHKDNESFQLIDDVFFVGLVDDAAFEGNKSLSIERIKSDYDGILIFGVTLKERPNGLLPTRSQLAEISRAFNREFYYTPAVIVFKYGKYLAFANTERLKYKQEWREGEKAGKVSLLRDIEIENTHSGHERILAELKIPISGKNHVDSFAKLYTYWQNVFSVSVLNKKFYQELSNWYYWATKHVTFPGEPTASDAHLKKAKLEDLLQEQKATNVIRMLTRLLFVWFIKEKKLIPEEIFDLEILQKDILNEISPYHDDSSLFQGRNKKSVYYKAILQNLFFATLNCPIEGDSLDKRKRGFRGDGYGIHRGIDYLMRHKQFFKNPDAFLETVNSIVPFLNGGLFECLDDKIKNIYVDGFSDGMPSNEKLIVPDYLFFGLEEEEDLSDVIGIADKKHKKSAVKGLINILKSYKFTITENTPIEEDVALDPELLGKVFENLLASYNPETKTSARKQTGSFYTPREIVNYMVDESLIAYLKNKILNEKSILLEFGQNQINICGNEGKLGQQSIHIDINGSEFKLNEADLTVRLNELVSFDPRNPFKDYPNTTKLILNHLSNCTILDPACGSGAFPMGVLQKMVHILQKLDPENKVWKEVQLQKAEQDSKAAFEIEDKQSREERLLEINEAFDQSINDSDYARKLFLIENCIYGVDIQPIATQISKLRFFISLVVEQKFNREKDNFGIRPLPNLETKFVAANTLVGVEKLGGLFETDEVKLLENELKLVRHKIFSLRSKERKIAWREKDEILRKKLSELLKNQGLPSETAEYLSNWDPYNQNQSSPFFDKEWMFGINEGFDVIIGNPPYIKENTDKSVFNGLRKSEYYQGKMDLWYFFASVCIDMLKISPNGCLCFIATNNWITNSGASKLRNKVLKETQIIKFIDFSDFKIFESAGIQTMVFLLEKNKNVENHIVDFSKLDNSSIQFTELTNFLNKESDPRFVYYKSTLLSKDFYDKPINFSSTRLLEILDKIKAIGNFNLLSTEINSGIDIPQDFINKSSLELLNKEHNLGEGIFVLSDQELVDLDLNENEKKLIKPFYTTAELYRYKVTKKNKYWIIYTDSSFKNPKSMLQYPKLKNHLDKFQKVITSENKPYGLNRARDEKFFKGERLIVQRKCPNKQSFVYVSFDSYFNRTFLPIRTNRISLKFLSGILNSKLISFWLKHKGKMQGDNYQVDKDPVLSIPIYNPSTKTILDDLVMITINSDKKQLMEEIIDAYVFNLYFPEHMKEKNIDIIHFIEQDFESVLQSRNYENLNEFEKKHVFEKLIEIWSHPDNEVRNRIKLFAVRSPEILKPILES